MNPFRWLIPLGLVSRLVYEGRLRVPDICPCGGRLRRRGPYLFDCTACGRLQSHVESASVIQDQVVAHAMSLVSTPATDAFSQELADAFSAHASAMADVLRRHEQLVHANGIVPKPPEEVLRAHALGLDACGGIRVPVVQRGYLASLDVVTREGLVSDGSAAAAQVLFEGAPGEVVVAPRGLGPLLLHGCGKASALGLHSEEGCVADLLTATTRTVLFLPGFSDDRLHSLAADVLAMGIDARVVSPAWEGSWAEGGESWMDPDAVRATLQDSLDLVSSFIGKMPPAGSYGHEDSRLRLQILIGALPDAEAARRDRYAAELAARTGRRRREVQAEVKKVRHLRLVTADLDGLRDDPLSAVVWPATNMRPLRWGQDAAGGRLVYTERVVTGAGSRLVLVSSDRKLIPVEPAPLSDIGLEAPQDVPALVGGRWSQVPSWPNSLRSFLDSDADTRVAPVFDDLCEVLRQYVWFRDDGTYGVLAATIIASYLTALASTVPYVFLFGFHRTGKTLLLEILEALCFAGHVGLPTRATLYRLTHFESATLLVDEVKRAVHPDVLAILKTGYRRGGKVIITLKGSPHAYCTYGIKFFAGTAGYDHELLDRGILLHAERREERRRQFDGARFEEEFAGPLRDRLHCIALANAKRASELLADPETEGVLVGREREIFLLPAAIARLADDEDDGTRWEQLMAFAAKNESAKEAITSAGGLDPDDLIQAVAAFLRTAKSVPSHRDTYRAELVSDAVNAGIGKSLTPRQLGGELVRIGLLATSPEDRPKLWVQGEQRTHACWRLLPERLAEVARKFGVQIKGDEAEHAGE